MQGSSGDTKQLVGDISLGRKSIQNSVIVDLQELNSERELMDCHSKLEGMIFDDE